ncbi:hypothetical protein ACNT8L_05875 [Brucella intermedia]|uniref:hypothetical protein n=1 Tax=Brucella intermedia TaxID=94625 RepID=UPI003AB643EA
MSNKYKPWENMNSEKARELIQKIDELGGTDLPMSLGRTIIVWSQLEHTIQSFLMELMNIQLDHFLATVGQLNIYQKIDAVVAITANKCPDEEWRKHITELRGYITGTLRDDRNRLAHDFWINEPENKQSIQFKPTVNKKTNTPNYLIARNFSNDELDILSAKIFSCLSIVIRLRDIYFHGKPAPWQQRQQEGSL